MTLTNPADIQRHIAFKESVDDLSRYGHIRHYSAEIAKKTEEDRSNIVKYYKGTLPIGDNFWKKFQKAYGALLKRVRGIDARKREKKPLDPTAAPLIEISPPSIILDNPSDEEKKEKLIDLEWRVAQLEQRVVTLEKILNELLSSRE